MQDPGFIPEKLEEAASSGGAELESGTGAVFEGAGAFPVVGSVISFGAGTVIGSEVCHTILGIEGCWYFESEGADPSNPSSFKWEYVYGPQIVHGVKLQPFNFYAGPTGFEPLDSSACKQPQPGGTTGVIFLEPATCGKESSPWVEAERNQFANRNFGFHSTDTAMPNFSGNAYCTTAACTSRESSPPESWPSHLAEILQEPGKYGISNSTRDKVGESIAAELDPTIHDPYANYVKFPSSVCKEGLKAGPCVSALEELDLVPDVKELDWDEAVVEELDELDPEKTREEESEKIVVLPPVPNEVKTGTPVEITQNPDKEGMPEYLPAPDKGGGEDGEGEEPDEYKKRLVPIFIPNVTELDDGTLDPEVGPGKVSHTVPGSHHRFNPKGEHEVEVDVNPKDAPEPGAGGGHGGGSCGGSVGAIDWGPLNHSLGAKFPFGVFGFFVGWIGEWEAGEGTPPSWSVTLLPSGVFGSKGLTVPVNLSFMAPVVGVVRVALLFASFVGLLWFLGTAAAKIQGDGS